MIAVQWKGVKAALTKRARNEQDLVGLMLNFTFLPLFEIQLIPDAQA